MSAEQNEMDGMAPADDPFEEDPERVPETARERFLVDLDGFEGIDVLLSLARDQKVDLVHISILALADQYLQFVTEARRRNLELAADYLVMAAWLAYLKSRLLLPDLSEEDEPSGEEMAAALQFQLRRLEAMQEAGQTLMSRDRLGHEFFGRGNPEFFKPREIDVLDCALYDLLKAYAQQRKRKESGGPMRIEAFSIYTVEDALQRLRRLVGRTPDWDSLWRYLPENLTGGLLTRSAIASTFAASLELAKEGKLVIRQHGTFGPIYLRPREDGGNGGAVAKMVADDRNDEQ